MLVAAIRIPPPGSALRLRTAEPRALRLTGAPAPSRATTRSIGQRHQLGDAAPLPWV